VELDSFISIDTETTGLDFQKDKVIQFGCSMFIRGKCVHRETFLIQSDIPNGGFEVNQISDEDIANKGIDRRHAAFVIASLLDNKAFSHRVVIYNAPFDLSMLANEFIRQDISFDFSVMQVLDPLIMWRHFKPFTPGKLVYVANALGIPYENAHDAGADSEIAGHVYLALRNRYGLLQKPYISGLQRSWHSAWTIQMQDWARQHNKEMEIEPWPIRDQWMSHRRDRNSQQELLA
jgi:DNA polymerase III subunit epsilon